MRTRFVMMVNSQPRTVFSVREKSDGDLNIHTTSGGKAYSAPTLNELVTVCDETLFEECNKHISIHVTPKNPEQNVIKRTLEYPKKIESVSEVGYHFTTGIKLDNLFVPVLFRISGDLSRDRYALPLNNKDKLVNLGQYDPANGQLRLMLVVSGVDKKFPQHPEHSSNFMDYGFNKFRLTLFWSFLNLPSHPQAIDFFLQTSERTGPMRGLEWNEIYNLYNDLNMEHARFYIEQAGFK